MDLSKRAWLGLIGLLSALLTGIVVRDVFVDWLGEGKPLWSTLVENIVLVALAAAVFIAGYALYRRADETQMAILTRWQYLGAAGIFVIAVEVVGLQFVQGELKPYLIITQMTVGGAAAGTLVGYANGRRQEAREQIERERDKFEALFENATAEAVEVELVDDELVVRATNEAFEDVFDASDAVGTPLEDIVQHDGATTVEIQTAVSAGETTETKIHAPTADGQRDFQIRVVPFGDSSRAYVLYTDITELQRAKDDLEQTVSKLERSNERLQQFAYVASHDLQEPARMVSSYVSLLDREYGDQFDEEAREYMEFATDGADRMQAMIDGLLDYSRVRTNAEEFSETDADDVLDETLTDLELLLDEHGATVTSDALPTVRADRSQLGQVFQNLVENALEHGGTEIHVESEQRDGDVVFSVTDDGPGIPEDQQDRIFEIFEQGSRDADGTGMGLAICDRIVSRHHGELWVDSEAGAGATFSFTIPS